MEEIWKDIVIEKNGVIHNYSGLYQISNFGRVKTLNYKRSRQQKILKHKINNGYCEVQLCKNNERNMFRVHRLVANAFIPNPDKLPEVNHKDENRTNNNVNNLEWCDRKYNENYGTKRQRQSTKNARVKKIICLETFEVFEKINVASKKYNCHNISECLKGQQKSSGKHPVTKEKLHWMYYDEWLEINKDLENKVEFVK